MHTKGPWAVDLGYELYDGSIHPMTIFTDDGKGNGVEIPNRDDYDREWRNTEACANAHLISSAPDLLEALESCVAMLDRLVPEGAYCPGINGVLELARAAITKAKGTDNA